MLKIWGVSRAIYHSALSKIVYSNNFLADGSFLSPSRYQSHCQYRPTMTKGQLSSRLLQSNLHISKVTDLSTENTSNVLIWSVFSSPYPCFYPYHDHPSLCFHSFPGAGPFLFQYQNHNFCPFACLGPFLNHVLCPCLSQIILVVDYHLDSGFGAVSLRHHAYPSSLMFFLPL